MELNFKPLLKAVACEVKLFLKKKLHTEQIAYMSWWFSLMFLCVSYWNNQTGSRQRFYITVRLRQGLELFIMQTVVYSRHPFWFVSPGEAAFHSAVIPSHLSWGRGQSNTSAEISSEGALRSTHNAQDPNQTASKALPLWVNKVISVRSHDSRGLQPKN